MRTLDPDHLDPAGRQGSARPPAPAVAWVPGEGGNVSNEVENRFRRALVSTTRRSWNDMRSWAFAALSRSGTLSISSGVAMSDTSARIAAARSGSSSEALSTTWMSVFAQMDLSEVVRGALQVLEAGEADRESNAAFRKAARSSCGRT